MRLLVKADKKLSKKEARELRLKYFSFETNKRTDKVEHYYLLDNQEQEKQLLDMFQSIEGEL